MRKVVVNICIFLGVWGAALYWLDYIVNKGLRTCNYSESCFSDVYNSRVNADVLVLGASTAKMNYSPRVLDSILHINCYNIGMMGWRFHLENMLFNIYLQHNKKPKYVIHDIHSNFLETKIEIPDRKEYVPYANDSTLLRYTEGYDGSFSFAQRKFPLFAYNNNFNYVKMGVKSYFHIGHQPPPMTYKGYYPYLESFDGSFAAYKKIFPNGVEYVINDTLKREFYDYLRHCRDENIKVILVVSPVFYEQTQMVHNIAEIRGVMRQIARDNNIPLLDYTDDTMCFNKDHFINSQHLNIRGSEKFSQKLANDLQPYIHI